MKTILSALGLSLLIFTSCGGQKKVEVDFIQDNIDNAVAQNTIQTDIIEKSGKVLNPRTIQRRWEYLLHTDGRLVLRFLSR